VKIHNKRRETKDEQKACGDIDQERIYNKIALYT
jgi:hypothetical protein